MKFLIVDVDDTLFDWTTMWSRAFNRLLDTLAGNSPELRIALLPAMRELHRAARTSERGLSALDATCLGATSDLASRAGLELHCVRLECVSLLTPTLRLP
jgi:hypothetical protein